MMNKKGLKVMKKLFNECKRNPKTPDIYLPPIDKKHCSWWTSGKKQDYRHKQFLAKINIEKIDWEDFVYRLYNHITDGYILAKRSKLFKELSKKITYILINKHIEEHRKIMEEVTGISIFQKTKTK